MNRQQKDFAMNRVYNIFRLKANAVNHDELARKKARIEKCDPSLKQVLKDISDGILVPIKYSQAELDKPFSTYAYSLELIYDMASYRRHLTPNEVEPASDQECYNDNRHTLINPANIKQENNYFAAYPDTTIKYESIVAALNQAADAIMLGDNNDALTAIAAAEAYDI
jgi:hypothetical protein